VEKDGSNRSLDINGKVKGLPGKKGAAKNGKVKGEWRMSGNFSSTTWAMREKLHRGGGGERERVTCGEK